jgi:hypothetical protein
MQKKIWYWNPHGKRFFGICKVYGIIILKWAMKDTTALHTDPWPVTHRSSLCFLATLVRMCGKVLWEMQRKVTCESTCKVGSIQPATIKSQEGRGAGNSLQHGEGMTSFCCWSDNWRCLRYVTLRRFMTPCCWVNRLMFPRKFIL